MTLKPKRARVEKIQLYFCRDIEDEKLALDIWQVCLTSARPQEIFRSIVMEGIKTLAENGGLPPAIMRRVPNASSLRKRVTAGMHALANVPDATPEAERLYRPVDGFSETDGYGGVEAPLRPPMGHPTRPIIRGGSDVLEEERPAAPTPQKSANNLMGLMGLMGNRPDDDEDD